MDSPRFHDRGFFVGLRARWCEGRLTFDGQGDRIGHYRGDTMQTVRQLAEETIGREGGYVNDPDDPGGATNFGVTVGTMRRLGLDLTGDGLVDAEDVKILSRDQAVQIFLRDYYEKPRIASLPEVLRASVFDMYVNAGSNAVKILQRLLRQMGEAVAEDGVIGPLTAAAAYRAAQVAPAYLADAYGIARRNYYFALADARPASRKYAVSRAGGKGGWIRRAEDFISPRYHLSEAAFRQRISAWG
ncbi:Predicted Peptidoglycan domain-containing protein [Thalassovita litoralis]|uniref:Predicted Peptidoglycan domain-containing protein n=2 Tax=Thalassovita litoralis TaxID=1010611 RepID=A0A521BUD6_9RHOB|nr:Predicted Peptidoglycan domain-containing protein [Thalassovita litoralis]